MIHLLHTVLLLSTPLFILTLIFAQALKIEAHSLRSDVMIIQNITIWQSEKILSGSKLFPCPFLIINNSGLIPALTHCSVFCPFLFRCFPADQMKRFHEIHQNIWWNKKKIQKSMIMNSWERTRQTHSVFTCAINICLFEELERQEICGRETAIDTGTTQNAQ